MEDGIILKVFASNKTPSVDSIINNINNINNVDKEISQNKNVKTSIFYKTNQARKS